MQAVSHGLLSHLVWDMSSLNDWYKKWVLDIQGWIKWKFKNANKISKRNPLVLITDSTKVSDISKQITPLSLSTKMRIVHTKMVTKVKTHSKEGVHKNIYELHTYSAHNQMFWKDYISKYWHIPLISHIWLQVIFHLLDPLKQHLGGKGSQQMQKCRKSWSNGWEVMTKGLFFCVFRCWFIGGGNALQGIGTIFF